MDGTCAYPGEISDPHKSLVCTPARPVGIPKRRWEDVIKMGFKPTEVEGGGNKTYGKGTGPVLDLGFHNICL